MKTIYLVVKGDVKQAVDAAATFAPYYRSGLPGVYGVERQLESSTQLSMPYTDTGFEQVQQWFMADLDVKPPYAIGSLLFYNVGTTERNAEGAN